MSRVRQAVDYLRALVDTVEPFELPGRRFRFVPCLSLDDGELPAQDRDYTIEPRGITGLGTPLGSRCLAARVELAVVVHYRRSQDVHEDSIRISQDAAQLATSIYETPTPASAPWYAIEFSGVSTTHFEAASRLELTMSALQRVI
jgi:hypothetical protein